MAPFEMKRFLTLLTALLFIRGTVTQILPHHRSWPDDDDWIVFIKPLPNPKGLKGPKPDKAIYAIQTRHLFGPGSKVCAKKDLTEDSWILEECQ